MDVGEINKGSFDLYAAPGSPSSGGGSGGGGVPDNGSITKDMLSEDLASEFTKPIAIDRLPQSVRDDLNRSITREMLPQDVRADLNRTITRDRLSGDILADLNRTITREMLPQDVRADLNRTITRDRLSGDILADLNRTITREMLPQDVRADLNRTITRDRLSGDILADLNRSITREMLSQDVRADLNRTITRDRLSGDILADLNRSITREMLPQDVRADLNRTITRDRLSGDILADLNRTITREMLPQDVRADLNRTITRDRLSGDILADLNRSITREMLPQDVRADLNRTITRDRLSGDILADLNRSITREMLPQDVRADLNRTITREMLPPGVLFDTNGTFRPQGPGRSVVFENPYGWNGEIITCTDANYTVPADKVLVVVSCGDVIKLQTGEAFSSGFGSFSIVPSSTFISTTQGWTGMLMEPNPKIIPLVVKDPTYQVPVEKNLIIISTPYSVKVAGKSVHDSTTRFSLIESGKTISITSGFHDGAISGYLMDANASLGGGSQESNSTGSGGPLVDGSVTTPKLADYAVTPDKLSESILKYLMPELTSDLQVDGNVSDGSPITMSVSAEGKFLNYQWYKDGQPINGATSSSYTFDNEGNNMHGSYHAEVSNDFGKVASTDFELELRLPQSLSLELNSSVSLELLWVKPGTFTMGGPAGEAQSYDREGNVPLSNETEHNVTLTKGYYLGKYEVTQKQYEIIMEGNEDGLSTKPSKFPNSPAQPNRPVEEISFNTAEKFITRLNNLLGNSVSGWEFTLPTEAQWEYACRAGTKTPFSYGSTSVNGTHATQIGAMWTTSIGRYEPNPWGFYDMHGNVFEWTSDWYAPYSTEHQTDPTGPSTGTFKVLRGGSGNHKASYIRSANREPNYINRPYYFPGGGRYGYLGIRVLLKQKAESMPPSDAGMPEFILLGDANVTHYLNTPWVDPGVVAHDLRDGNLTSSVAVSGTVDVNSTGTYTLTYTVRDDAGNEANATRIVNVVEFPTWQRNHLGRGLVNVARRNDSSFVLISANPTNSSWSDLVKIDPEGNEEWRSHYIGVAGSDPNYSKLQDVAESPTGELVVIGYERQVDSDYNVSNSGGSDFLVRKHDSNGTLVWEKTYGGSADDRGKIICATPDGGFLLFGTSSSDISGDKSHNSPAQNRGTWLIKIDSNGSKVWDKSFGAAYYNNPRKILPLPEQRYLLLYDTEHVGKAVLIDTNGNTIWDNSYDFSSGNKDPISDVELTDDGGFIFSGYSWDGTSPKGQFVIKTDENGNEQWSKIFSASNGAFNVKVSITYDGYLVSGSSRSNAGFDKSEDNRGDPAIGGDIWLVKTDFDGNKLWDKTIGGDRDDTPIELFEDSDDGLIIFAASGSTESGDKTVGHTTNANYDSSIWALKLKPDGTF